MTQEQALKAQIAEQTALIYELYKRIKELQDEANTKVQNKTIGVIRNPYERAVSEYFVSLNYIVLISGFMILLPNNKQIYIKTATT